MPTATALTIKQFANICHSTPDDCSKNTMLQAYVGGALDLLATLNERKVSRDKLYCKEPKVLFDVPTIIHFMENTPNNNLQEMQCSY